MTTESTHNDALALLDKYQLEPGAKLLLPLLALINCQCEEYDLARALKESRNLTRQTDFFTSQKINKYLRNLKVNKLLDPTSDKLNCDALLLHELRKYAVTKEDYLTAFKAIQKTHDVRFGYFDLDRGVEYAASELRFLIYTNQDHEIDKYDVTTKSLLSRVPNKNLWSAAVAGIPLDVGWLKSLKYKLQLGVVCGLFGHALSELKPMEELISFVLHNIRSEKQPHALLAEYYLLTGDQPNFLLELEKIVDPYYKTLLFADYLFLQNHPADAIKEYQAALKLYRKLLNNNNQILLSGFHGRFYLLAYLLNSGAEQTIKLMERVLKYYNGIDFYNFRSLAQRIYGDAGSDKVKVYFYEKTVASHLEMWLTILVQFCFAPQELESAEKFAQVKKYFELCKTANNKVFAYICAEILAKVVPEETEYSQYLAQNNAITKIRFTEVIVIKPLWETYLEKLSAISTAHNAAAEQNLQSARLVWFLNTNERYYSDILYPAEQEQKNGRWKRPKKISLKKFYSDPPLYLTEQDKKIRDTLAVDDGYGYGRHEEWHESAALKALVGHPFIFEQDYPNQKIELVARKPHLVVTEKKGIFNLQLVPYNDEIETILIKENDERYVVVEFDAGLIKVAAILGKDGLTLPQESKQKLLGTIKDLAANITIDSAIEITDLPILPITTKLEVQLMPYEAGLQVEIVVRQFGDSGEAYPPGVGSKNVITVQQMQKVQIIRDFAVELKQFKQLCNACPTLKLHLKGFSATISDPMRCLKVLAELKALDELINVSWPRGEMMRIQATLSFDNLKLRVKKEQDWFAVTGEITVNDKKFMSIKELLDLLDYNDSPFIPLSVDKFISLNEHFKKQLQKLKNIAVHTSDGYQVHKLASVALDDIMQECKDIELDAAWQEQVKKLATITTDFDNKLSKDCKAVLRPYQVDGFNWLSRMAQLGIGACLADDMGLGKTVQTIALLLTYAQHGPILIVAPTSVCYNWLEEIQKFAPSLKPHLFADLPDREALLQSVAENDAVICSYGLVQRNIGLLHKINWQIIVLDEAQAIKNSTAKRTQAVDQLQSNFRLALTGTPIENHLGELWSLFRFLNPGFLGSEESFFKRFIVPIEQHKNEHARTALKNLIKPFILRRMKNAVLQELPPKTETTITVELSEEEQAFYEGLRVKAIDNITKAGEEANNGQARFKILAEITKLRLACCHSTLVHDEIDLPSSKLEQFLDLLNDILENKHRVLVFSQFVSYLAIIKKLLTEKGIAYQYLDGQTPQAQRKTIIADFQNGKAEVFLLSLKAGGVGLNLTAADYVILLDPWWNPAVETQATDRAHRIGQTKPVNIYRLISKQTIEEKILQLHQTKKDLANDLLSDADMSGKLTTKELLKLISTN